MQAIFLPGVLFFCFLYFLVPSRKEGFQKVPFGPPHEFSPERLFLFCSPHCVPRVYNILHNFYHLPAHSQLYSHFLPFTVLFYKSQTLHKLFQYIFLKGLLKTSKQINHYAIISPKNLIVPCIIY